MALRVGGQLSACPVTQCRLAGLPPCGWRKGSLGWRFGQPEVPARGGPGLAMLAGRSKRRVPPRRCRQGGGPGLRTLACSHPSGRAETELDPRRWRRICETVI